MVENRWKPRFCTHKVLRSECLPCSEVRRKRDRERHKRIVSTPEGRKRHREQAMRNYLLRRDKAVEALGAACECCGEHRKTMLDIDHVHGNGAELRRERGEHHHIVDINNQQNLEDYQLLCSNCNQSKQRNGGICQHKDEQFVDYACNQ